LQTTFRQLEKEMDVKRTLFAIVLLAIVVGMNFLGAASARAAAGQQPFFAGKWRCTGYSLDVSSAFGPWFGWRFASGSNIIQMYIYHDTVHGGWVNVGVDSRAGYWTMTSSGWQGSAMTFNGTYTQTNQPAAQRLVITRNAGNAFTIQTWRNGNLAGQIGCNR
jgi:hypothetical protein